MNQKVPRILTLALLLVVLGATQQLAQSQAIYNNIPNPLPGNLPSVGYEATGTSEFGDRVAFAGTDRSLTTVVQTMSSWGCQAGHWTSSNCVTAPGATFSHPITLNIYNVVAGNQVGTKLATITRTFAIPYRPSVDLIHCTGGKWYQASSATCFNGKAVKITFDLTSLNIVLPNQVIYGIAYNTSHYGYAPIGQAPACYSSSAGCGYDSLNVAVADPVTSNSVGSNPAPNDAYQYTIYSSCSNGPIIPFGLDAGCWTGYKPAVRFNAEEAEGDNNNNHGGNNQGGNNQGGNNKPN